MFDMMNLLGKVKEVQTRLKQAKEKLATLTLTSSSGAGMVKATVNGERKLIKLEIDPEVYKDKEMTQDLIVAAVNIALRDMDEKIKEELKKSTDGVIPNIPGLDLGNMF